MDEPVLVLTLTYRASRFQGAQLMDLLNAISEEGLIKVSAAWPLPLPPEVF